METKNVAKFDVLRDTVEILQEQAAREDSAKTIIHGLERTQEALVGSQQITQRMNVKHREIIDLTGLNQKAITVTSQQASVKKLLALEQREQERQQQIQLERRELLHEIAEQGESNRLRLEKQFGVQATVETRTNCLASDLETATKENQEVVEAAQAFLNVSPSETSNTLAKLSGDFFCRSQEAYLRSELLVPSKNCEIC
jgi:hypothetical protein